ncbi:hypothetical protein LMG28727_02074 [Paraburkholderia kirstenboschensis]|uniref:hypothetical protein n=1 Tax=Paraburkholderia kirstenboschensis TaxID=1245436 RepID=UPI000B288C6C|nr:hypothetical protein [Paraburkholderia kirstenboschensis]CAD6525709.1 hypothetical protein LMG28727_02074 [Paraburkholderia kirstenboschensis]
MVNLKQIVAVADDDESVCRAIVRLMLSVASRAETSHLKVLVTWSKLARQRYEEDYVSYIEALDAEPAQPSAWEAR